MHLNHISSTKKGFALLDLEHYFLWFNILALTPDSPEDVALVNELYTYIAQILLPEATGLLLSPHFGWDVLHTKPAHTGVVFSLEQKTEELDPLANPLLSKQWTIEHIVNNYGIAKLEVHYHPEEALSVQKRKIVAELGEYARYEGIDFIVDLKIKTHTEYIKSTDDFQNAQLQAIKHFRELCDCMFLEAPNDALSAATITAELDIPWVVTTTVAEQKSYSEYKEIIRMNIENGARGAVIGTAIMADEVMPTPVTTEVIASQVRKFLATTGRDRMLELRRIIEEGQVTN